MCHGLPERGAYQPLYIPSPLALSDRILTYRHEVGTSNTAIEDECNL